MCSNKMTYFEEPQVKGGIKKEIGHYLEVNENETTTHQNLWDVCRAVLRREVLKVPLE